jgi:hypothetical protein
MQANSDIPQSLLIQVSRNGNTMSIHAQRSAAHFRGLKFQRVRRVYSVLTDEWQSIPEIIENLLANENFSISSTSIKKYVWDNDFEALELSVEADQKNWRLRVKS